MLFLFYVQELPKALPAVVLVLKLLRRRGNGLKSHPTDWKKPGIKPATSGLQDIGLSPTPQRLPSSQCPLCYSIIQFNKTIRPNIYIRPNGFVELYDHCELGSRCGVGDKPMSCKPDIEF